jgi:hypothetical protein
LEKKMRKPIIFLFVTILLAACGQAAVPTARTAPTSPSVVQSTSAPQAAVASPIPTVASSLPPAAANCTVLSKDEVGTILAEPVLEIRDPVKDGSLCVYQTQNLILEFNTQTVFGGFVDSVNFMQQFRANYIASGETPLDVPGLGDEAFYHGGSGYVRVLLVRKGAVVYSFGLRKVTTDYSLSSPDNAEELEKALADLLLTRVP